MYNWQHDNILLKEIQKEKKTSRYRWESNITIYFKETPSQFIKKDWIWSEEFQTFVMNLPVLYNMELHDQLNNDQ